MASTRPPCAVPLKIVDALGQLPKKGRYPATSL